MEKGPAHQKEKNTKDVAPASLRELVLADLKSLKAARQQNPQSALQQQEAAEGQMFVELVEALRKKGRHAEVKELIELGEAARNGDKSKARAALLHFLSLYHLILYQEFGEPALQMLPFLFLEDCYFFLGEPWIRRLFAHWHQQGEQEKILQALYGARKDKKGIRSYKLTIENIRRNRLIVAEVDRLINSNSGYNDAMRQVSANLKALGINDRLSPVAIRKIYEQRGAENMGLVNLLFPR